MTLYLLNVFGFEILVFLCDFIWKNNTFSVFTSISFFQLFDEKLQNCKDDEQRKASTFCLKNCLFIRWCCASVCCSRNSKYTFIELSKSLQAIWITYSSYVVTKLPKKISNNGHHNTKKVCLSEIIVPLLSNILKCFQQCWKHFNLNLLFFNL